MPIDVGPTIRRRREWARLTQQELIDQTRIDRSASYLGSVERGKTSPTLEELERLARYFRLSVVGLIQEAGGETPEPEGLDASVSTEESTMLSLYASLTPEDRKLAVEIMQSIDRHRKRRP